MTEDAFLSSVSKNGVWAWFQNRLLFKNLFPVESSLGEREKRRFFSGLVALECVDGSFSYCPGEEGKVWTKKGL
jgi:hypothetical protein